MVSPYIQGKPRTVRGWKHKESNMTVNPTRMTSADIVTRLAEIKAMRELANAKWKAEADLLQGVLESRLPAQENPDEFSYVWTDTDGNAVRLNVFTETRFDARRARADLKAEGRETEYLNTRPGTHRWTPQPKIKDDEAADLLRYFARSDAVNA